MRPLFTAVLRLHDSSPPPTAEAVDELLRPVRGVFEVRLDAEASMLTIVFDSSLVTLGTLVRQIEDGGGFVCGVRRHPGVPADAPAGDPKRTPAPRRDP